jgi:hypothetical protein
MVELNWRGIGDIDVLARHGSKLMLACSDNPIEKA